MKKCLRAGLPAPALAAYVIVDIQMIGRKAHAPTGLDGWIGFKNQTICELSNLPYDSSLPGMQAVVGEAHNRLQLTRHHRNRGSH